MKNPFNRMDYWAAIWWCKEVLHQSNVMLKIDMNYMAMLNHWAEIWWCKEVLLRSNVVSKIDEMADTEGPKHLKVKDKFFHKWRKKQMAYPNPDWWLKVASWKVGVSDSCLGKRVGEWVLFIIIRIFNYKF